MKAVAAILLTSLVLAGSVRMQSQETQAEPSPTSPTPKQTTDSQTAGSQTTPQTTGAQTTGTQKTAPVVRRAVKPSATSVEQTAGPLTKSGTAGQGQSSQPVNRDNGVATIKVRSRLVNVAVNVVDANGAPVSGFDKPDFRLFEDSKPQTIAVFDREATSPLSIVLAIDESGTVFTSERLEKEAAKHFVQAILREQDELDLMDFADTVREIVPFTNQIKRVEQGIGELQHGDETALYNAIYLAGEQLAARSQEANRRRVLVVISDGGDQLTGGEKYEEAIDEAQRANVMIYSIIIVPIFADAGRNTGGEHALIQMSEDTGGKYYYVVDPKDLEPAFRHVSDDLRTQYVLGYYAPEPSTENPFRRIQVKLTDGAGRDAYSLRYRTGYFADGK